MSPPTSPRKIVIHHHIFKNAGTSIEGSLDAIYGPALRRFETDRPDGHLWPEDAAALIAEEPDLRAITSHQLHPPAPIGDHEIFPLVILREPISRVRSAYLFEWLKQPGLTEAKGSFAEYVQQRLERPGPGVVADFQVSHLSRGFLVQQGQSWTDPEAALAQAQAYLESLPAFGLVEQFARSVAWLNIELARFHGHDRVQLTNRHDNVTQGSVRSVDEVKALMTQELGHDLYQRLEERNQYDLQLYHWAVERFNRLAPALEVASSEPTTVTARTDDAAATADAGANPVATSSTVTPTAEPDPVSGQAGRSPLQVARLERRVEWQDQVLSEIEEVRREERRRLEQMETRFQETRRRLLSLEASAEVSVPAPIVVESRRSRLLSRAQAHLESMQDRYRRQPDVDHDLIEWQRLVAESGLFDPEYYLEHNPDVVAAGANPLEHFVVHGGGEGRAPSELFDAARYLDQNPDVRQAGVNPLIHYVIHGRQEGRQALAPDGSPTDPDPNPHNIPEPAEFNEICSGLRFDQPPDPDASIIIPIYNQVGHTLACLEAVAALETRIRYEVIVMDDASDDPDVKLLDEIEGLRYVRNQENLGFLRNCNRGAELARGRYLAFLNNDTRVDGRWLDTLVDTFSQHDNVGLAGSKLVYGDGRLQEAGGIVFADGSGWNYGRNEDPDHPDYNYVRDVDYASGASIMIERDYFERLGRFDEEFAPAYYEDTDLCFRVRADGRRVVYQPASVVTHYEGISSGTDIATGVKMYQAVNKVAFEMRWRDVLQRDHQPDSTALARAADPAPKGNVLIIDATIPTPDQDSGSIDMFNLIRIITDMGYRVHFVPSSGMRHAGRYTEDLQQMGVKCVYEPFHTTPGSYIAECGDIFDTVIMARVNVATACLNDVLLHCPSARHIFYTVDLHFLRARRSAETRNDRMALQKAELLQETELAIMDRVDTTVVLSRSERQMLEDLGRTEVAVIPLIRDPLPPPRHGFDERSGVLFVGGFRHPPNVDAVEWLLHDIWPLVRAERDKKGLAPIPLRIIGSNIPRRLRSYAEDVEIYGFVENIDPIFERALLSLAPLRYGAGLKGKIATSFDFGVPVIGTSIAFEGMPLKGLEQVASRADTAEETARMVIDLIGDRRRWEQLSAAGRSYNQRHYSLEANRPRIAQLLGDE